VAWVRAGKPVIISTDLHIRCMGDAPLPTAHHRVLSQEDEMKATPNRGPAALFTATSVALAWLAPMSADARTPTPAENLSQVQELWTKVVAADRHQKERVTEECGGTRKSGDDLAEAIRTKRDTVEIERLGRAMVARDQSCVAAKQQSKRTDDLREDVGRLMGRMTADFGNCSLSRPDAAPCAAVGLTDELKAAAARHALLTAPAELATDSLLKAAEGAQAKVAKLKSETAAAFSIGDEGASLALQRAQLPAPAGADAPTAAQAAAVKAGLLARTASVEAERAKSAAQVASNELVDVALQLARCNKADSRCAPGQDVRSLETRASAASARLDAALALGEASFKNARLARWTVQTSDLVASEQDRAVRFLSLIEDNADAKALFGQDAAFLSASTAGSEATLRISLSGRQSTSVNRFNLSFSAPLNTSDKRTNLWQREADGLSGRPSVRLSWNRFFLPSGSPWAFSALGLTAATARGSLNYVDSADPSALKSFRTSPASAGLQLVASPLEKGALHTLRIERERSYDAASASGITCPATPAAGATVLNCLTGSVGLPMRKWATVSTYDYRQQGTRSFDLGVSVSHNAARDLTDVFIPVYFIQSGDKDATGKRNAGISLGWGNKGRGTTIGVFIGSPFSLRVDP
jgi:hypothetical protein